MDITNPTPRSPNGARAELRALGRALPERSAPTPMLAAWLQLYTGRIARYLVGRLDDEEVLEWELAFTVLHEMVGQAYAARPRDPDALREQEAWGGVRAARHLRQPRPLTLLPPGFDLAACVPLMRGFLRFLYDEGALFPETLVRLDGEYAALDPSERARGAA